MESLGQNIGVWTEEWRRLSIESEIEMWDYYGLRPFVLKYTPRFGKVVEAGCGLGRYNFYLSHFGVNIAGLDFSEEIIEQLKDWQNKNGYNLDFIVGDVTSLPFEDNSLRGYLSFGVVEHFQEGPQIPIAEAYRVLQPGGVAIITVPNNSWNVRRLKAIRKVKTIVKKIINKYKPISFFQYEYTPKQLKKHIANSGLYPTEVTGSDFLYTFTEYSKFTGKNIRQNSFALRLSRYLDNTIFRKFGAQSITISVKVAEKMHCFLCGELSAEIVTLKQYTVPICKSCSNHENANNYLKSRRTYFKERFIVNPPITSQVRLKCSYCNFDYLSHPIFEKFGLSTNICPDCLKVKENSIKVSCNNTQPIWRHKSPKKRIVN
jgi:ubiquinone/menaquinone biosynthesis C-methylase UbiE